MLKGRTVADGRGQRGYVTKEEAASPALGLDTFILSLIIDAFEGRDVGLFDVPGAFLQAMCPDHKFVLIKFEGEFVDIMIEDNPIYVSEVRIENGKRCFMSNSFVYFMGAWSRHYYGTSSTLKSFKS